jgi:3-oxoacyl-[acyl-carrier protein] reductase
MFDLTEQVAFVTGAAQGIGACIADKLAASGAAVAVADMDETGAQNTAKSLAEKYGVKTMAILCNVADFASVEAAMKKVVDELGKISILINNAGITRDKLIMRMSEEDWRMVIDVNLTGTFNCTKCAIRQLSKTQGSIVNVASVIGLMGNAGQANYAASKAGMIGLTKSTAKEYARKGIRANAIAPGFIETKMTEVLDEEYKKNLLAQIPFGRMGTPEEVADVVAFLVSKQSKYITGQVIAIDGGMVM